ncbi:MAG TPA: hypothetical protein VN764_14550 [Polyangiaceae bacterium]|nr:hypothetical protein [Polyangiaceae bacterium]
MSKRSLSMAGPESRGASILEEAAFHEFLERALGEAQHGSALCGLVMVQLRSAVVGPPPDLAQAAQILGQLVRQRDAVCVLANGLVAIVLSQLERRSDAYVMLDRVEGFTRGANLPWVLRSGVSIFPFSGDSVSALWEACSADLDGAISSDSWEHTIPRDTLHTHRAG